MVKDDSGEPMFVGRDLVLAVGAEWKGSSTFAHIPEDLRGVRSVRTPSGDQEMVCLYEPGMNMYLFRSDKPAALPWQRFLAEEVLPQIRKTGRYERPGTAPQLPGSSVDTASLVQGITTAVTTAMTTVMTTTLPAMVSAIANANAQSKAPTPAPESKPRAKAKGENQDQLELEYSKDANRINAYAKKVMAVALKLPGTDLEHAMVPSDVWDELVNRLAVIGLIVPTGTDDKRNHYIARMGWRTQAIQILSEMYSERNRKLEGSGSNE